MSSEAVQERAYRRIPDGDRAVGAGRGEQLLVRTESETGGRALLSAQREANGQVPNRDFRKRLIVAGVELVGLPPLRAVSAPREQLPAVGTKPGEASQRKVAALLQQVGGVGRLRRTDFA
jgi:hypothetical protein